jgi:hypothetical protein
MQSNIYTSILPICLYKIYKNIIFFFVKNLNKSNLAKKKQYKI